MRGQIKIQTLGQGSVLGLLLRGAKEKFQTNRRPACNRLRPLRLLRLLTTPTLRLKVVSKTDYGGYGRKQAGEVVREIRVNNILIRKEEYGDGSKTHSTKIERKKLLAKGGPHEKAILGLHKCEC